MVSNELLYARFAWALIKIVGASELGSNFDFSNGGGGKYGGGKIKRKRRDDDNGREKDSDERDDRSRGAIYGPGGSTAQRQSEADIPIGNALDLMFNFHQSGYAKDIDVDDDLDAREHENGCTYQAHILW